MKTISSPSPGILTAGAGASPVATLDAGLKTDCMLSNKARPEAHSGAPLSSSGGVAAPPYQRQTMFDLPAGRVLLPVKVVMAALDRDQEGVMSLIDRRLLPWGFDLRCKGQKVFLAVWTQGLKDYLSPRTQKARSWEEAAASIIPMQPTVGSLARAWTIDRGHLCHLAEDGEIKIDPRFKVQTGRGHSTRLLRDSVVEFLRRRKL